MNDENIEVDLSPGDVESATCVWLICFQVQSRNVSQWWNKHERINWPILKKWIWTKQTKDRVGQQNNERESNEVQRPNTVFARFTDPVSNGWRVESNSVCNQNRTTAQRESDLLITSMITDRIGRHEILLPINHKNYNYREKKNSQVIWKRENLH